MTTVRELEIAGMDYIKQLAELHRNAFPSFFLTQLGIPFLCTLYMGYMEDDNSGILIAEDDGELIGFIAYSNDYSRFYKGLIKHHLFRFAACSFGAAIRHPAFIKRLLGAFKKSESVAREEKYVELASICVDPKHGCKGIGSVLINFLKKNVDFNTYAYINLETDADGNDAVNRFYMRNGFRLERTFITPEGRKMNEYRYKGGLNRGERESVDNLSLCATTPSQYNASLS